MAAAKQRSAARPKKSVSSGTEGTKPKAKPRGKKSASAETRASKPPSLPPARPSRPPPRASQPPARPSRPPPRASQPPARPSRPPPRASQPPARPSRPPPRASQPPPDARTPRTRGEPWPATAWLPENHDVATAQDVMLLAYWLADQLGDGALSEPRRAAMRAALRAAAPILRNAAEGLSDFAVAAAVRRNGAILGEAQRTERERVPEGSLLGALLEAHEDEAVHSTVGQLRLHSPEVASWLEELERRGRPELRNALRAFATLDGDTADAMRRLVAIVMFGTDQLAKRAARRG